MGAFGGLKEQERVQAGLGRTEQRPPQLLNRGPKLGLDVVEVEPTPIDNPLLSMDNVVVTPHLAGSSEERVDRALVFSFENARRVLAGEEPEGQFEVLV